MNRLVMVPLVIFFLFFSLYPTIFELQRGDKIRDPNREFILEHNYYWPDYNLYLSKIRQGFEGRLTALEKYTSETHQGSLIQEFYVVLGWIGKIFNFDPNAAYLLGRVILAPLLLIMIYLLVTKFFPSLFWQIIGFLIVVVSASFPRIYQEADGTAQIGRFMEWWSNIDALQRITFIPHILFGQVVSFFILYQFIFKKLTTRKLVLLTILGNLVGFAFPPSLITLDAVIALIVLIKFLKTYVIRNTYYEILFFIGSLPSLIYFLVLTKQLPWYALVDFHRTHPMMIPFTEYIQGTGPVFFIGIIGMVIAVIRRRRQFYPMIYWFIATFLFAILFTHIKEQSPLRFTQTGLFIPLGILATLVFYEAWSYLKRAPRGLGEAGSREILIAMKTVILLSILFYIGENLFMMKVSMDWQTRWLTQLIGANVPAVPYPPQAMFPLREWMNGVRWLRDNTNHEDVVIAEVTAGNYIPAYSGNTVYFGQANTVDYERKQREVTNFFTGTMAPESAKYFLTGKGISYVFYSIQEKERSGGKDFGQLYPFLKPVYTNSVVTIYRVSFT